MSMRERTWSSAEGHSDGMVRQSFDDPTANLLVLAENLRTLQNHPVGQEIPQYNGRVAVKTGDGPDGRWEVDGQIRPVAAVALNFDPGA